MGSTPCPHSHPAGRHRGQEQLTFLDVLLNLAAPTPGVPKHLGQCDDLSIPSSEACGLCRTVSATHPDLSPVLKAQLTDHAFQEAFHFLLQQLGPQVTCVNLRQGCYPSPVLFYQLLDDPSCGFPVSLCRTESSPVRDPPLPQLQALHLANSY